MRRLVGSGGGVDVGLLLGGLLLHHLFILIFRVILTVEVLVGEWVGGYLFDLFNAVSSSEPDDPSLGAPLNDFSLLGGCSLPEDARGVSRTLLFSAEGWNASKDMDKG